MFHEEGSFTGTVTEIVFAEPKFATGPNDFDVCLHVIKADDPEQSDWWRGEMSQNYGKGNFATMTQAEITMHSLKKVGFEGEDLTELEAQLLNKEIPFFVKKTERDGKTYYNIRGIGLGGGDIPKPLDCDVRARMAALMGGGEAAAPAQPASRAEAKPAAKKAAANPFKSSKSPFVN